ncbi:hypothetical protein K450DRAFT_234642 [Umbelopsis ramanniana AG]|uniref:DDHD domain-containing protein n=1 Tax=Umbelopsis ramanniana AG TaxID=1314678 RepID=A0AAD5HFH2_UMBRA|nr:uncharacterized protein K450DRAFT_234642 [Umbelopsis ramanniana AG]KAI8581099.1 hypothetical protein K450DRAFT_234642 [Umbelopsis ramanniana AG]
MSTTPPPLDPLTIPLSQGKHRPPRPRSLNPEPDVPTLDARWFHAADNPISDPAKIRRARSQTFKSHSGSSSPNPNSSLPPTPKAKAQPSSWIAFSNRDSLALERAYQSGDVTATVAVNEDELFQVDVSSRTISPVYWSGPTYDVRRATWFIQSDGSKWIPCEETLAEQIELGYYKHKPWVVDPIEDPPAKLTTKSTDITESAQATTTAAAEEKKLEKKLEKQPVEKQWMLLGPYMGQYIAYTGPNSAWLLSNTPSGKITKRIYTRLTNNQNLGGTRLLRGYSEVSKQSTNPFSRTVTSSPSLGPAKTSDEVKKPQAAEGKEEKVEEEIEAEEEKQTKREVQDYENEESGDEPRKIDHLVLVIHGIGQKMTERLGSSFVHDVNVLRKTLKTAFPSAIATTSNPSRHNGIQVLPIHWRQDIVFGMASTDESVEADLGMPEADDGPPTLDELTLDGVPNIRMVVSDVLLDIPLYMTPKYRDQMLAIITSEINRVYLLFIKRNPDFLLRGGKVSIYGHSLGSLLAFDVLAVQPFTTRQHESASAIDENRTASHIASNYLPHGRSSYLHFPVQNFFAVGSPLGFMLLLKGCKISSRKLLAGDLNMSSSTISMSANSSSPIPLCYPAVGNLYNIFKQSDPVAYRLEPLISRHYSASIKPETVPFTKGGLKSVLDAGYNVGSGIANRAGAMLESFKMGITTNLFMRGLGLTKQQMYDDLHPQTQKEGSAKEGGSSPRTRSSSDPSPPLNIDLPTTSEDRNKSLHHMASYSYGARKLKMLNSTGRVDWCVQEGLLENPYLNAFTAHTQYWQDLDVAAFIIREMYQQ